jgi:hypothetical protein
MLGSPYRIPFLKQSTLEDDSESDLILHLLLSLCLCVDKGKYGEISMDSITPVLQSVTYTSYFLVTAEQKQKVCNLREGKSM